VEVTAMGKVCNRDGWVRALTQDDVQPGTVIREVSKEPGFEDGAIVPPFADAVIIGVKDGQATIARPYLYATGGGTACPNVLVGFEKFELSVERLLRADSIYMLVVGSRGQSFKFET
jgi:hypothetical protein